MTSPRQLVHAVSSVLGVPVATVTIHDRNLAVAGLRSVAGRGRRAARITSRDATNLVIASAASPSVKDSVKTVQLYSAMKAAAPMPVSVHRYDSLLGDHDFGEGLFALIEAAAQQEITAKFNLKLSFYDPNPRVRLRWNFENGALENWYYPHAGDRRDEGDLVHKLTISERAILELGACVGVTLNSAR
jgi:hypothetical protein